MSHFMFVLKLLVQLVDNFCDRVPSKWVRSRTSDKEERLNGNVHILWHCEDVKSKECFVCSNRIIKNMRRQTNYFYDMCSRNLELHIGEDEFYDFSLISFYNFPFFSLCFNERSSFIDSFTNTLYILCYILLRFVI